MSFIFKWLRPDRPAGVSLHPVRTIELYEPFDSVFARCITGIDRVLGGIVRESDPIAGRIDATFGLINSERLTVTIERSGPKTTRVTIESRRNLSPEAVTRSDYVDALAKYLESPAP